MTDVSPLEVSATGTTGDDYVNIAFDIRARKGLTIHLKNTGSSKGLTYRVDGYAKLGGAIAKEEVAAANLAATAIAQISITTTKKLAQVILQIKSQTSGVGNETTYAYEAISAVY
jgi:hypothetical protein